MLVSAAALLLQGASAALPPTPPDPRLLRDARGAQVRFESVRRMHLPRERWRGGGRGECDARIGRYCYWYDSTESKVVPEPTRIGEARATLLAALDSAAAKDPADKWIAGQRIRYLLEAGRLDDAIATARSCRAERAWCASLEGLALHVAQRYVEADSVFSVALREMPAQQRCEWLDLRVVVPDAIARELSRVSCEQRASLDERVWVLAQPLWTIEGRDARTEHFARMTMASILERSANAHGMPWGADSRELLIRYGWAEWFTRQDPEMGGAMGVSTSPMITGHDREPSYAFFPDLPSTGSRIPPSVWRLNASLARSRYSPRHLKHLSPLAHQLVRFPRGDSMLVRVAYAVRDTGLRNDSVNAAIGIYRQAIQVERSRGRELSAMTANDTVLVSIEVLGARSQRAERARYTIDPVSCAGGWCISDLLLFDPNRGITGTDMDSIFAVALTDARVRAQDPLGVFWESQTRTSQPVWLALTVEPVKLSIARLIATRLHLAREQVPVRLRWQASVQAPRQAQSLSVRLPSGARGRYRVIVTAQPPDGPAVSSMREIEVLP